MHRAVQSTLSGFTPAPDALIQQYGYMTALVWGRVWRYCQMSDGVCRAKLETIAGELGMSDRTIMRHIDPLVNDGYLADLTPDLKNRPHIYADTGKMRIKISIEATVTESRSAVTQSHPTVTESHRQGDRKSVEESIKKESKNTLPLSADDFKEMSVEQARKVPELKLYARATGFFPGSLLWHYVYQFIRDNGITEEQINTVAIEWASRGYQKENIKGILEWTKYGIPPVKGKNYADKSSNPKIAGNGSKPDKNNSVPTADIESARRILARKQQAPVS